MDSHARCDLCKGRGYVSDGQIEDGMMTGRKDCPGPMRRVVEEESVERVRKDQRILLEATVRKLHAERKMLHEMLTEAGVPEAVNHDGERSCLIARVAAALDRLPA